MSDQKRYCPHCARSTEQYKDADATPSQRLTWGAFTFGVSELMVRRFWRCQRCGNEASQR